jgi:integrase/recombinase XerD
MVEEHLKNYLNYLIIKGYSEETSIHRTRQIKDFLEHHHKEITQITSSDIIRYSRYLKDRPNKVNGNAIKITTVFHHIRAIELFYEMLLDTKEINTAPEINITYPKNYQSDYVREILTQEEVEALYQVAGKQETIILHLAYGCGLRVGELTTANRQDFYLKENFLIVPKGKFNKRRIVPLTERMSEDLNLFFSTERLQGEAVILNSKGDQMQEWTYNSTLKTLLKKTGISEERIQKLSIHSLRHSIATHLIENGMELEKVRDFLGHSQLETTEVYTHITINQLNSLQDDS